MFSMNGVLALLTWTEIKIIVSGTFYLVTEMNIPAQYNGQTIKSLGGIENFAYLEQLTCSDNTELTSLDLSKCSYLKSRLP